MGTYQGERRSEIEKQDQKCRNSEEPTQRMATTTKIEIGELAYMVPVDLEKEEPHQCTTIPRIAATDSMQGNSSGGTRRE